LYHSIIIVASRRIKPNCRFETRWGLTLPQLRRQVAGRPRNDSFSFGLSKLALNFPTVRADDEETAVCELSRDYTREIGVRGMRR